MLTLGKSLLQNAFDDSYTPI